MFDKQSLVYQRQNQIITRQIAGETLLVPIRYQIDEIQHLFAMNPVASHIWQTMDGKMTVADLISSVCATFDAEKAQVEEDVFGFIEELMLANLIKPIEELHGSLS